MAEQKRWIEIIREGKFPGNDFTSIGFDPSECPVVELTMFGADNDEIKDDEKFRFWVVYENKNEDEPPTRHKKCYRLEDLFHHLELRNQEPMTRTRFSQEQLDYIRQRYIHVYNLNEAEVPLLDAGVVPAIPEGAVFWEQVEEEEEEEPESIFEFSLLTPNDTVFSLFELINIPFAGQAKNFIDDLIDNRRSPTPLEYFVAWKLDTSQDPENWPHNLGRTYRSSDWYRTGVPYILYNVTARDHITNSLQNYFRDEFRILPRNRIHGPIFLLDEVSDYYPAFVVHTMMYYFFYHDASLEFQEDVKFSFPDFANTMDRISNFRMPTPGFFPPDEDEKTVERMYELMRPFNGNPEYKEDIDSLLLRFDWRQKEIWRDTLESVEDTMYNTALQTRALAPSHYGVELPITYQKYLYGAKGNESNILREIFQSWRDRVGVSLSEYLIPYTDPIKGQMYEDYVLINLANANGLWSELPMETKQYMEALKDILENVTVIWFDDLTPFKFIFNRLSNRRKRKKGRSKRKPGPKRRRKETKRERESKIRPDVYDDIKVTHSGEPITVNQLLEILRQQGFRSRNRPDELLDALRDSNIIITHADGTPFSVTQLILRLRELRQWLD